MFSKGRAMVGLSALLIGMTIIVAQAKPKAEADGSTTQGRSGSLSPGANSRISLRNRRRRYTRFTRRF